MRAYSLLVVVLLTSCSRSLRHESFDSDPGWDGHRNRLRPERSPVTRQDFGWSATDHAGGERGELGGWMQRSLTPARYFLRLPRTYTFEDRLEASGRVAVTHDDGSSGVLIGWFHESSRGWRTSSSLAFRLDGNSARYWVFYEYGTRRRFTGGGGAFEGDRYQTTPTPPFRADRTRHRWRLTYDPDANDGAGEVTFRIDDRQYVVPMDPSHRADGAVFDRFGIWTQEATGSGMEAWIDDLVVNGARFDFDEDPGWEGVGNRVRFEERVVRPFHDYGHDEGAARGVIFRDEEPSYWADIVGPLSLEDELFASGTISIPVAGVDSALSIGWFDAKTKRSSMSPRNTLAVFVEGPSRVGHYVRAAYRTSSGRGLSAPDGPVILPDGKTRTWSIHYRPEAGTIVVTLDGVSRTTTLEPGHRQDGASFDRFGIFNMQRGGWHVVFTIDDLVYTAKRGG